MPRGGDVCVRVPAFLQNVQLSSFSHDVLGLAGGIPGEQMLQNRKRDYDIVARVPKRVCM